MAYAQFWRRATAAAIDFTLVLVLAPILAQAGTSRLTTFGVTLFAPLLVPLYEIYFHARWGQTIGKRLMDIVVLDVNGNALSVRHALLRSSVGLVLGLFSAASLIVATGRIADAEFAALDAMQIATRQQQLAPYWTLLNVVAHVWFASELVTMLSNRRRRALHDFIAGTVVVDRALKSSKEGAPKPTRVVGKSVAAGIVVLCCAPSTIGATMVAIGDVWLRNRDTSAVPADRFIEALATYGLVAALLGIPLGVVALVIGLGVLRSDRPRTRAGNTILAALATSLLAVSWLAWDTYQLLRP